MFFLFDTCTHPDILRVLYFAHLILDIVFVVVPIGLILMLMIDFSKAVITGDEKEQIKSTKLVTKRIMYAVIIFAMPWIVNVLMSFLAEVGLKLGGNYRVCINNVKDIKAGIKTFDYFEELLEANDDTQFLSNPIFDSSFPILGVNNVASGSIYENAADNLLSLARAELGHVGGYKYHGIMNGNEPNNNLAWCAYFANYIMEKTSIEGKGTVIDYILSGKNWNQTRGEGKAGSLLFLFDQEAHLSFKYSSYYGGNYTPKKGDIIYFWWLNTGHKFEHWDKNISSGTTASHIGFVDYVENGYVHTIEGNTSGDKVAALTYSLTNDKIMGYGVWYE